MNGTLLYYRLARREERDAELAFGEAYRAYQARVPMFVPRVVIGHTAGAPGGAR